MSLTVNLNFPADLAERLRQQSASVDHDVTEAFALELFRTGRISHFDLARVLQLDQADTDAWLKEHGVFDCGLTMTDLDADVQTLADVMGRAGR